TGEGTGAPVRRVRAPVTTTTVAAGVNATVAAVRAGIPAVLVGVIEALLEAVVVRIPRVAPGRAEQRIEQQHGADGARARDERGLPPGLGVPPCGHRTAAHPAAGIVVRSVGALIRSGPVLLTLDVDPAVHRDSANATGGRQRWHVGTRIQAERQARGTGVRQPLQRGLPRQLVLPGGRGPLELAAGGVVA